MKIANYILLILLCVCTTGFGQNLKDKEAISFNLGVGFTFMPIVEHAIIKSYNTSLHLGGVPPIAINPTYEVQKMLQLRSNLMVSTCTILPIKSKGDLNIEANLKLEGGVHLPWTEFDDLSLTVAGEADILFEHTAVPDVGVYIGYKYSYWGLHYRQPLLGFKFGHFEYYGSILRSVNYRLLSNGDTTPALVIREIGMRFYFE